MKDRILVALLLSAVLALPGFAQQSSSTSGAPAAAVPASQGMDTARREPLRPVTSADFWDGDEPNLVNLVTHPFARKKYVQRLTRPIKDRLNELDEITKSNAGMIKDIDARSQQGIQLASEKADLADQHATDAVNKAQMSKTAATTASTPVPTVEREVGEIDQYKASTQTEILFRPGQIVLSKQAKDALDEMAAQLKDQRSYIIEIQGFAPGSDQAATAASRKMAGSVVRYLVLNHKIPTYRMYMVGMGNAPVAAGDRKTAKHTRGGRVEVSLLKNDRPSPVQH